MLSATAVLTLGKDMTFRDYAQGAYRMRGIDKGQRLQLLLTPEVQRLMYRQIAKGMGMAAENLQTQRRQTYATPQGKQQLLKDVVAWLVINSMRSEKVQFNLLCEQRARHVWRKQAYRMLVKQHRSLGSADAPTEKTSESIKPEASILQQAVDVFRERLVYQVENTVPVSKPFSRKIKELIDLNQAFLTDDGDKAIVQRVLLEVVKSEEHGKAARERALKDLGIDASKPLLAPSESKPAEAKVVAAKALYDFQPGADGDLGLKVGMVVQVLATEGDWWTGTFEGKTGIFPSNYVELCDESQSGGV